MPDLNGSLTLDYPLARRRSEFLLVTVCAAVLSLAACHDDSTTAPLTASTVTVLSGGSQSGTVGAALAAPVVLQVNDQNGKALAGVAVTLTVGANAGSVPSTVLTTDANGQVSTSWTLGTVAATDTLAAQVGALPVVDVVATAAPGAAASVVVMDGDGQTAAAGASLSAALTVKVVDQYGNGVPNVTVTFADDANGALAASTVTTDASGIATDALTLGPNAGPDDVTASIDTPSGTVSATLHETAS